MTKCELRMGRNDERAGEGRVMKKINHERHEIHERGESMTNDELRISGVVFPAGRGENKIVDIRNRNRQDSGVQSSRRAGLLVGGRLW